MRHLVLFYYIISFGISLFSIGWLAFCHINKPDEKLKYAIIIISCMAILMLSHYWSTYSYINNIESIWAIRIIRTIIMMVNGFALCYNLMMFMFVLTLNEVVRSAKLFFLGYAGLVSIFSIFALNISNILLIILMVYAFGYTIYFFWFEKQYVKHEVIKRIQKYSIVLTLGLALVIFDAVIPMFPKLDAVLPYGFLSLPSYMILISAVVVIEVSGYFKNHFESKDPFDDKILKEYGLTNREREVIICLFDGSTYQETADNLNISLATAKTHINNIYKKMEVSNKIEMMNKLK